jgi:Dullard-like phosphatase family protein
VSNQGSSFIYQKNKINNKNRKNIVNEIKDKDYNDINISEDGKIEDINYEYLRIGTDDMTYNTKSNVIKNTYLNLSNSYLNFNPGNNTFYHSTDKQDDCGMNNLYNNKDNIFLNQSSPFYQKKLKKPHNPSIFNNMGYKRIYLLNTNNCFMINIENILIFEEKFNNIVSYFKNNLSIIKPCLDFWNYYYNSWVYEKIEKIFNGENDMETIRICINYLLLSVMICYYFALKKEIFNNSNYLLSELLELNYNSIMLIFQQIKNNIAQENEDNTFLPVLIKIYNNYSKNSIYVNSNNFIVSEKIHKNNEKLDMNIKNILSRKKSDIFKMLYNFSINLRKKNYIEINEFFIKYILHEENLNGSLFSTYAFISSNESFNSAHPPFLKTPNKKKLTLILDLNETLINFKMEENGEGYVRIRPFLFGFLEEVSQLYELIIFTSSEKEYADSVIEAIEHERTYFDHVFYRQHTIIVGNDFVKDLTRIGRPLNSTIIIDNMPQNFKLQKENGILIKPFWGQDSNDKTLYDLMPILLDIAKEGGDVRYGLNKYRNEIIEKISSNISRKKYGNYNM